MTSSILFFFKFNINVTVSFLLLVFSFSTWLLFCFNFPSHFQSVYFILNSSPCVFYFFPFLFSFTFFDCCCIPLCTVMVCCLFVLRGEGNEFVRYPLLLQNHPLGRSNPTCNFLTVPGMIPLTVLSLLSFPYFYKINNKMGAFWSRVVREGMVGIVNAVCCNGTTVHGQSPLSLHTGCCNQQSVSPSRPPPPPLLGPRCCD